MNTYVWNFVLKTKADYIIFNIAVGLCNVGKIDPRLFGQAAGSYDWQLNMIIISTGTWYSKLLFNKSQYIVVLFLKV